MNTKIRISAATVIVVTIAVLYASRADVASAQDVAQQVDVGDVTKDETPSPIPGQYGVLVNESRAFPGYNLINPSGKTIYLYDNEGRLIHAWTSEHSGGVAYSSWKTPGFAGGLAKFDNSAFVVNDVAASST